jgi:hypothetical protein
MRLNMVRNKTIGLAAMALVLGAAPLSAEEYPTPPSVAYEHDFTAVTDVEDVEKLVASGELVPILVVPLPFGGTDDAINTAYVTPEAAMQKEAMDAALVDLADQGLLNSFELEPEYRGDSLIPAKITFRANHAGEGERFDLTVEIW